MERKPLRPNPTISEPQYDMGAFLEHNSIALIALVLAIIALVNSHG